MSENKNRRIHWSFWAIAIITLVWNILGSVNFLVQMNPEMYTAYRDNERLIIEGRPIWATAGFAVAVFGGTLAGLLLLLKKPAAYFVFVASLMGVLVTTVYTLGLDINFGAGEILGIIVMPVAMAIFLVWYSKFAKNKEWLR